MKILITAPYHKAGRDLLAEMIGEVIYRPWKDLGRAYNEDELIALLSQTKAEALITEHDEVSEKVLSANPDLKFIGVCRGTPSNVALEKARQYGIKVLYTPARNAQAVAELFVANVISLLRKTIPSWQWLTEGNWDKGAHTSYLAFKGNELAGKTIGLVGFGAVGRRIAELTKAFPCGIQYYDPFVTGEQGDYKSVSLSELFQTSDIVSIHLPVNENTIGMIDHDLISQMKPDAIFVNTARGPMHNEKDLLEALKNKTIWGAGLDVTNPEPMHFDNELLNMPNVAVLPHIGSSTEETRDAMAILSAKNAIAGIRGERLLKVVNSEIYE